MPHVSPAPVILLFGLPGAGKTTIARAVAPRLAARGPVEVLDGDELRRALDPGLGFGRADRALQGRRACHVAGLLSRHGVTVVVALGAPLAATRAAFAAAFDRRGAQVHVDAPQPVRVGRDPAGVYAAAAARGDEAYRSIEGLWEPPAGADLVLDTSRLTLAACVDAVLGLGVLDGA